MIRLVPWDPHRHKPPGRVLRGTSQIEKVLRKTSQRVRVPARVTKPYKFMRFGAMDVTKLYKCIRFGAMDVTKPHKCIGFGAMDVTKPYEFMGFGARGPPGRNRCQNKFRGGPQPGPETGGASQVASSEPLTTLPHLFPGPTHGPSPSYKIKSKSPGLFGLTVGGSGEEVWDGGEWIRNRTFSCRVASIREFRTLRRVLRSKLARTSRSDPVGCGFDGDWIEHGSHCAN
jgi:hypothetical protein